MPATRDLVQALRSAGYAAVVSGAGPSVLVLAEDPGARIAAAELAQTMPGGWNPLFLAVDIKGATVEEIPA
jgi:homoserine kinase